MSVFVIADLHLSHTTNKPMDIFGARWENHTERLRENWQSVVSPDDTVIIAGDISWGMRTDDALADLMFIESLNGKKIIAKGNHDYWWQTMKKLYELRDSVGCQSIDFLFNNAYVVEDFIICGTRGWFPESNYGPDDEKIVNREVIRLKLSLDSAVALQKECEAQNGFTPPVSVFLHFPPVWLDFICRPFVDTLHAYGDPACYFGHIHGMYNAPKEFSFENIPMRLVSSDAMDFTLYRLPPAHIHTDSEDLC